MGLDVEIERVFRRVVESDLELISQSASAVHIPYHTTPQSSCMCACGIVAIVPGPTSAPPGGPIPINEQIYRIQKIIFNPVTIDEVIDDRIKEAGAGGHADPHHDYLDHLREELGKPLNERRPQKQNAVIENEIVSLHRVMAEHYRDEGPAVTILPRHMLPSGAMHIISVGAVHYVLRSLIATPATLQAYLAGGFLHRAVVGSLQRWPIDVTLLKGGADKPGDGNTYARVDVALKEARIDT